MSEVVEHLRDIRGLDNDNIIGYHGTSLEAIGYMIKNKILLGRTYDPKHGYDSRRGALSFYPLKLKFEKHLLEKTFLNEPEILERIGIYAETIAMRHSFLTQLGFSLDNEEMDYDAVILTHLANPDYQDIFKKYIGEGFSRRVLSSAIFTARKRKGFILGLDRGLLDRFDLEEGDKDEGDLRIHCLYGLSYELISGIVPMGDVEEEYLDGLE